MGTKPVPPQALQSGLMAAMQMALRRRGGEVRHDRSGRSGGSDVPVAQVGRFFSREFVLAPQFRHRLIELYRFAERQVPRSCQQATTRTRAHDPVSVANVLSG